MHCWWVNGTVILEDSLAVPHKLKYSLTLQLSNHTILWAFEFLSNFQVYEADQLSGSVLIFQISK